MAASFGGTKSNTAIHTDICSPLATDPTWSKLSRSARNSLGDGYELWHDLIAVLRPTVVLMSVAFEHIARVKFGAAIEWAPFYTVERERPYRFEFRRASVDGSEMVLVRGRAAQRPFGPVSDLEKRKAGALILEILR